MRLVYHGWAARARDDEVARDVAHQYEASTDALRVYKQLLPKEITKPLQDAGLKAREYLYEMSLPWDDGGHRLLPITRYDDFKVRMDKYVNVYIDERNKLITKYNVEVDAAKGRLGKAFKPGDFPTADELRSKITMEYHFSPVPDSGHFIAQLADEHAVAIKDDIERGIQERINKGMLALWDRIREAVQACSERLTLDDEGKNKIFRDSMVTNLANIVAAAPGLNITNDPVLAAACEDVKAVLTNVEANNLRAKDKDFEPDTYDRVKEVVDDVSARLNSDDVTARFSGYTGGI